MALLESQGTSPPALASPARLHARGRRALRPEALLLDATLVLRVGMALLFAANAAVAWADPAQFTTLVEDSGFDRLFNPDLVVWAIRANDAAIALALLVGWSRWPRLIGAWAGLYLLSVAIVKFAALA